MKPCVNSLFVLLLSLLSAMPTGLAAESTGDTVPTPSERLLEASAFLSELPGFTVEMEMEFTLTEKSGKTDGIALTGTLSFSGEDQARFQVVTPDDTMELYVSKEATFLYLTQNKQYLDGAQLGPRDKSLTAMPAGPFRATQFLLSDILHAAPAFQKTVGDGTVERRETLPLAGSDQIHVDGVGIAADFWVQQEGVPLLQKFALDLTTLAAPNNPNIENVFVAYTFKDWDLEPSFTDDYFTFQVPAGATKYAPPQHGRGGPDPMLDKPAPALSLPLHGEGTLDVAEHKGKNVVILDFWTTWCGPCRVGLPLVSRVAKQYEEKGVVLYAVNVGEDQAKVQAFVEQTGLTATVALDEDRVGQAAYRVDTFPKTVIIDKDGIVREVHAGVGPTMEQDLNKLLVELTE